MELVSVIIPTYNRQHYIKEAVESALAQDYLKIEVIVVDDGSQDNTESVLAPYAGRIKYIKQENSGPAKARNHGIKAARGEFITFLDSDDKYFSRKVSRQAEYLRNHSECGLVYSDCEYFDDSGRHWRPNIKRHEGWIFDKLLFEDFFGSGSCVMVKRSILEQVGFLNEKLITGEDRNLYLKIAKLYQVGFVNEPLVSVRMHPARLSYNYNVSLGTIEGLKDIIRIYPEYGPKKSALMRKALARRNIQLADELFYAGKYQLAKKHYWDSVSYDFKNLLAVKFLCYALMPDLILNVIKRGRGSKFEKN
ncbi:MAG: glycosyltransferase family 2 protein [Candidatus Omnitrophota bacterium]